MKPALALASLLFLSGCSGWFGDNIPDKVSGDSDGVVFTGSGDTDRRNAAAAYCSTFNKSAIVLPPERNDSSSLSRFACR